MASKNNGDNVKRLEIPFFDGVNTLVADNINKKQELSHCENARSKTIGSIEKREGTQRLGDIQTWTANYGLFYFESTNGSSTGLFRVSTKSGTTTVYYLNTSATWTALSGGGTSLTGADFDTTIAEGCCFLVNGSDVNRYIGADGTTVTTSATAASHIYNSPKAYKINYYKDRLYIGDYTVSTTRYKNGIMMSSYPLGLLSLVDGDHASGITTLNVTDSKYIRGTDSLDVYRGGTKIETITVSAKAETSITVNATSNAFKSSDELWVANTYTGTKLFRWADNPKSGSQHIQYDTFKLSGSQNDALTMMENIGDVMVISNKNNMTTWNDSYLKPFDIGVGCVSNRGYVKALGTLWFLHYTGIYATTGSRPRLMSAKVSDYINGATKANLESAAAGRKGLSVFFAIGDVTLYKADGSTDKTLSDVCLEYNMRQENWYVHTGIKATQFATYLASTNADRLEYSTSETNYPVWELLKNTTDDSSVAETEIPFRADSANLTLAKSFEKICYPSEVIVEAERGSNIKTFVSLDGAQFYELKGDSRKGCTILKVHNVDGDRSDPPRCRNIKISLRDYSKSLCKITRVAIIYKDSTEEELFRETK